MKLILFIVSLVFSNLIHAQGYFVGDYPVQIQKDFIALNNKSDTFILYERSCSHCSEGTISTVYFFYKNKSITHLNVYRWNLSTGQLISKFHLKNKQKISSVIDFATLNYDTLKKILTSSNNLVSHDVIEGNVVYVYTLSHGPKLHFYVKIGKGRSFDNYLKGAITIDDYNKVSLPVENFFMFMNRAYSKYNQKKVLDTP